MKLYDLKMLRNIFKQTKNYIFAALNKKTLL